MTADSFYFHLFSFLFVILLAHIRTIFAGFIQPTWHQHFANAIFRISKKKIGFEKKNWLIFVLNSHRFHHQHFIYMVAVIRAYTYCDISDVTPYDTRQMQSQKSFI